MIDSEALTELQSASHARAAASLRHSWPSSAALAGEDLKRFLNEQRYCVLATVNAQARPIARPVAFTVIGTAFWFATVGGSRLRNLQRARWASVVVEAGDPGDHRAVAVDGPVTITAEPATSVVDLWAAKHGSRAEWAAAWFSLEPERVLSYSDQAAG